jgi:hypothetical protein
MALIVGSLLTLGTGVAIELTALGPTLKEGSGVVIGTDGSVLVLGPLLLLGAGVATKPDGSELVMLGSLLTLDGVTAVMLGWKLKLGCILPEGEIVGAAGLSRSDDIVRRN